MGDANSQEVICPAKSVRLIQGALSAGRTEPRSEEIHEPSTSRVFSEQSMRCFGPAIPVMNPAQPGTGGHRRKPRRPEFHWPSVWRVLIQRIMNPVIVVEVDVIANQTSQVCFVPCDDVVEDLAAAASDPSLRRPVLPWRPHTGAPDLQTGCLQEGDHTGIEFRIVVQDDIAIRTSLRECFT